MGRSDDDAKSAIKYIKKKLPEVFRGILKETVDEAVNEAFADMREDIRRCVAKQVDLRLRKLKGINSNKDVLAASTRVEGKAGRRTKCHQKGESHYRCDVRVRECSRAASSSGRSERSGCSGGGGCEKQVVHSNVSRDKSRHSPNRMRGRTQHDGDECRSHDADDGTMAIVDEDDDDDDDADADRRRPYKAYDRHRRRHCKGDATGTRPGVHAVASYVQTRGYSHRRCEEFRSYPTPKS
eukprot:GHVU01193774.1.p1 GENE.GHVU01193774.1~~GHVU01193774.1.p1  ORF type:complete len:239 (+),score=26.95 GHVU01193774.1:1972-2688(+)